MENGSDNERFEAPAPEEHMDRRGFLGLVKNWSAAVVLGVVAAAALVKTQQAQAGAGWVNSRGGGGGGWANRSGGGSAGWANRSGGGGGGWANRAGGGTAGWVNSRGGGGAAWANRR